MVSTLPSIQSRWRKVRGWAAVARGPSEPGAPERGRQWCQGEVNSSSLTLPGHRTDFAEIWCKQAQTRLGPLDKCTYSRNWSWKFLCSCRSQRWADDSKQHKEISVDLSGSSAARYWSFQLGQSRVEEPGFNTELFVFSATKFTAIICWKILGKFIFFITYIQYK